MDMNKKTICVFCGSRNGESPIYIDGAKAVAKVLASKECSLVYGGAGVGLMGVLADECLKLGVNVTGVLPENFHTREIAHHGLTKLIRVKDMHERKFKMYQLSDAFLVLPGGLGTMDELFEIVTWKQIGLHSKPIWIWNANNYYNDLIKFLGFCEDQGFVSGLKSLLSVSPNLLDFFKS